jgi:hypothetical protein
MTGDRGSNFRASAGPHRVLNGETINSVSPATRATAGGGSQ